MTDDLRQRLDVLIAIPPLSLLGTNILQLIADTHQPEKSADAQKHLTDIVLSYPDYRKAQP